MTELVPVWDPRATGPSRGSLQQFMGGAVPDPIRAAPAIIEKPPIHRGRMYVATREPDRDLLRACFANQLWWSLRELETATALPWRRVCDGVRTLRLKGEVTWRREHRNACGAPVYRYRRIG